MTTPAPDQGALERAREIFRLMTSSSNPNDHITALAAALTAAASEARAAAIVAVRGCPSLDENGYICEKGAAIKAIRALATPAQVEPEITPGMLRAGISVAEAHFLRAHGAWRDLAVTVYRAMYLSRPSPSPQAKEPE